MQHASYARMCPRLVRGYADLWANNQVTHELTLSLGIYPGRFDAEAEFIPTLRNLVRKASQKVRGVPKRQLRRMTPHHPDAFFLAGFEMYPR